MQVFRTSPGDYTLDSSVGMAWGLLWGVAMIFLVGSGLGVLLGEEWWRFLAIAGSVISIVAVVPWWESVVAGAKAGVALDVAVLLVLVLPWGERITEFFEVP